MTETTNYTPGVTAWLTYLPRMMRPGDAEYLQELGLAEILYTRREPVALAQARMMTTVEPTAKALAEHKRLTKGGE